MSVAALKQNEGTNQEKSKGSATMGSNLADDSLLGMRLIQTGFALLVGTLVFYRWILVRWASLKLYWKTVENPVFDGEFVERRDLDRQLKYALQLKESKTVLVYGTRGNGKTSLIFHALRKQRGVISIYLKKKDHDEVQTEIIDQVARSIGFPFGLFMSQPDEKFVGDVFAACPVRPIVVMSMEAKATGAAMDGVLVLCKCLSYNRYKVDKGRQGRFILDLSGSRAATEAGIDPMKSRVEPVHVGHFKQEEAKMYISQRIPTSFKDVNRRNQIAELICEQFDANVLTLQTVCHALRFRNPTDLGVVKEVIDGIKVKQEFLARDAWAKFQELAMEKLLRSNVSASESKVKFKQVAELMLKGPTAIDNVGKILREASTVIVSSKDIGAWNAEAGIYHPFDVDPFNGTIAPSGSAITAVFRDHTMVS